MKNYKSTPEQIDILTEYNSSLKSLLLSAEKMIMRQLIDAPFIGGPRFTTVIGSAGRGKTSTLLWLTSKQFYVQPKELITVFSEARRELIVEKLERFGCQTSTIDVHLTTPTQAEIRKALATSAVVIFDQPLSNSNPDRVNDLYRDVTAEVTNGCFSDLKYQACRGILFGINGGRLNPSSPLGSNISMTSSDLVLTVDLHGSAESAPAIRTLKNRFTVDSPTFYMIPEQINKDLG